MSNLPELQSRAEKEFADRFTYTPIGERRVITAYAINSQTIEDFLRSKIEEAWNDGYGARFRDERN